MDFSTQEFEIIIGALEMFAAAGEDNEREDEARDARAIIERIWDWRKARDY